MEDIHEFLKGYSTVQASHYTLIEFGFMDITSKPRFKRPKGIVNSLEENSTNWLECEG